MSDDLYNQIIQPNYTKLLQDVRPIDIVDLLHQYECINADDMEKIDKRSQYSCYRDGMKALLNILRQKGSEAVRTFVSVLGESGYVDLEKKISENRPLPDPDERKLVALGFASMTPFSNESHHVTHSYSASYFSHCVQDKEARSINLREKTMGYFNSLSLHPTVQELHCYPEEKITFNINSIFVDWCRNRREEKIQEEKMKEEQRKMLEKEMCRILREEMIPREIMIKIMIEKERKMLEEYIGSMNRYVHPTVPEIQGYQEKRRTYNYMYLYIGPKHDWYDQASFRKHPWSILTKDEEEKEDRDWCRNRREERIQEEKMKEEQRKMLEKDARNLKQNMTSTVNKPYHQDGNQNTVYNHPDNKLPNPVVNREKRSDQKAKGVNIKIGKQAGEDAKQLNIMKGKFLLTLLFLSLSLTNVPVTSATSHDCKWLPTNKTVKGLYETDITLVWKYESSLKVEKIDISRIKTEYEKENVASWTPEKGSVASRLISTDVTLEHRKEGAVGTIILTLIRAFPVDFDKIYSCIISSEHELHSMDTELEAYKLEYWPVDDVVEGRPGQDVKLVWIYKYPLPVKFVSFYLDNDIQDEVLSWSSFGIYIIEDRYKNRVKFNMTSNNDQVEITLTLLKTTRDDYNHTYHSQAMAPKGYWTIKEIYLRPSPVEDVKTVSSRQQPSSASGLSRVSIFLVCFVWLLAVQI